MKKQLIKCMFTALTFGMLVSVNTIAVEPETTSSIIIDESNSISLMSENAEQDGITAIKLSLKVKTDENAVVAFDFSRADQLKVSEYRYHAEESILNIYMADSEPLFTDSNLLNLGTVYATDSDGNTVDVEVTAVENSLELVSQNTLTKKSFSVDDAKATETTTDTPQNPLNVNSPSAVVTAQTTTTPVINGESKSMEVEKTFSDSYLITIPDGTESLEKEQSFNVSAENVLIKHGQTLRLSVTSKNGWQLMDRNNPDNDTGVSYRMGYGDKKTEIESQTETILTISEGKKADNVELTVVSIGDAKMAGTFDDTLTFEVNIS